MLWVKKRCPYFHSNVERFNQYAFIVISKQTNHRKPTYIQEPPISPEATVITFYTQDCAYHSFCVCPVLSVWYVSAIWYHTSGQVCKVCTQIMYMGSIVALVRWRYSWTDPRKVWMGDDVGFLQKAAAFAQEVSLDVHLLEDFWAEILMQTRDVVGRGFTSELQVRFPTIHSDQLQNLDDWQYIRTRFRRCGREAQPMPSLACALIAIRAIRALFARYAHSCCSYQSCIVF